MGIINSDEFATVSAENGGAPLKAYDVEINGHRTTVKLTDADAKRRGLLDDSKAVDSTANKQARAPRNKAAAAKAQKADG